MAKHAIGHYADLTVVGILGLLKIGHVTSRTDGRRALISVGMAFDAIDADMRPGQWELGRIMIERIVRAAGGVTGQTGVTVVQISADAVVLVICFGVDMAIGTRHLRIIGRVGMAIDTLIPFAVVGAAVDGEILPVVVEIGRRPTGFIMATCAICGELCGLVVGIGRLVVIGVVASETGIGRIVVIPVVASRAVVGDHGVRAVEGIIVVVIGKGGRHPVGRGGMAGGTIGGETQCRMTWIRRLVEIGGMTGGTLRRRTLVSVGVAGQAFHGRMRSGQRELGRIMVEGVGCTAVRMAGQTGRAVIGIPADVGMLVIGFGVGMTGGTRKFTVIRFVGMAFCALIPGAVVRAAVNGEMIGIVLGILGGHPTRVGGMAGGAIRREACALVIGAQCALVIGLMTGKTGIRGV